MITAWQQQQQHEEKSKYGNDVLMERQILLSRRLLFFLSSRETLQRFVWDGGWWSDHNPHKTPESRTTIRRLWGLPTCPICLASPPLTPPVVVVMWRSLCVADLCILYWTESGGSRSSCLSASRDGDNVIIFHYTGDVDDDHNHTNVA